MLSSIIYPFVFTLFKLYACENVNDEFSTSDVIQEPKEAVNEAAPSRKNFSLNGDISGRGDYIAEFILVGLVVVWIVSYVIGKTKNHSLAVTWIVEQKDFLNKQFALICAANITPPNPDELLYQESSNHFSCFASGRLHCKGMLVDIMLKRRQDFIMRLFDTVVYQTKDVVSFQVALDCDEKGGNDLFLLAMIRKGKQSDFRSDYKEFNQFTSQGNAPGVPEVSTLVLLSEVTEAATELFAHPKLNQLLSAHIGLVDLIKITDMNISAVNGFQQLPTRLLTVVCRLTENPKEMGDILEMVITLTDAVYNLKLSTHVKSKVVKNRKQLQEKIEKKKLEILKEEQEEKKLLKLQHERDNYDSMTPQEKKAFDVKNEKKLKKQEEKSKKVKVKM